MLQSLVSNLLAYNGEVADLPLKKVHVTVSDGVIETHMFSDDGLVPNNPRLPLIIYRRAVESSQTDPASAFEKLFRSNGWVGSWRNGIFGYHHYHSTAHEVLGIAKGIAKVQFGGANGIVAKVVAGDAVLIPAGVGHCRLDSDPGLLVIGAYPRGQRWDMNQAAREDHDRAVRNIPNVPYPEKDPIFGDQGPVKELWAIA